MMPAMMPGTVASVGTISITEQPISLDASERSSMESSFE